MQVFVADTGGGEGRGTSGKVIDIVLYTITLGL